MKKKILTTEAELAACVVLHLKEQGYTVYQEVLCGSGGIIDIYATYGKISWAIETKMGFGFSVLEQAVDRKRFANYVAVATPYRVYSSFEQRICKHLGLGIITTPRYEADSVRIVLPAALSRNIKRPVLNDYQLNESVAGSKGGGHWTPFKQTCANLVNHVLRQPDGILFRDAIKQIQHHYSSDGSAQSSLSMWIGEGKLIPELRLIRQGKCLKILHIRNIVQPRLNRRKNNSLIFEDASV